MAVTQNNGKPTAIASQEPENGEHPDYLRLILTSRVYDIVKETPLQEALNLNAKFGTKIYLKREDLQPVFSFKIRGAYNKVANLTAKEKAAGVIACSAGKEKEKDILTSAHIVFFFSSKLKVK